MSNSALVNYTKLSPNNSGQRNHTIDTITIHCTVGQCSIETLGGIFAPAKCGASSNYGVGHDGRVGMYVEEKNRSWCSSSPSNDNRAVTIEVASDRTAPYAVTAKAYAATIKLAADICKRNGIKKLVWSTDKNVRMNHYLGCNMTVHRDYANKSCPGDYLYNRMGNIAAAVNALIATAPQKQCYTGAFPSLPLRGYFKLGDKGGNVKLLQAYLNWFGRYGLSVDGIFGQNTLSAVTAFQRAVGLTIDGLFGAKSLSAAKSAKK